MKQKRRKKAGKNKFIKKINEFGFLFFILCIALFLTFIGASMNIQAILSNNCKMPVLTNSDWELPTHFSFQDRSQINHFYFADIFRIKNGYFSLGDIFMLFPLPIYSMVFFYIIIKQMLSQKGKI